MNLYKVSQDVNNDYDTYSDFVIACETEEDARNTNPGGYHKWRDNTWFFQYADGTENPDTDYSWCLPKDTKVELIGKAAAGIKGIICTSFHAG